MQLLSRKTAVICEEFCALRFGSVQVVKLISWKQNATIQNVRNTMTKCYYSIRKFFLRFSSRNYNISIKRAGSHVKYHVMGRTKRWNGDRRPILQIIALGRQLALN